MKNSQVAVLSAVIIAGSLIVAGSNWWLAQSVRETSTTPAKHRITSGSCRKRKAIRTS